MRSLLTKPEILEILFQFHEHEVTLEPINQKLTNNLLIMHTFTIETFIALGRVGWGVFIFNDNLWDGGSVAYSILTP